MGWEEGHQTLRFVKWPNKAAPWKVAFWSSATLLWIPEILFATFEFYNQEKNN